MRNQFKLNKKEKRKKVAGLLDEDLHDGPAHLHPHAVLLEHVQKRQEAFLGREEMTQSIEKYK